MKILIVTNMYPDKERPYRGIFVKEQCDSIKKYFPDVTLDVCYIDGNKGKVEYLKSIFYVNNRIRKGCYDIVHIHFGLSGLYLLSPLRTKVPTLVTFHGSDIQPQGGNGPLTLNVSRYVARHSEACVILNNQMESIVKQYNPNTFLIPCGVDTDVFYPHEPKKTTDNNIRIVFPSSSSVPVKNYPLFCQVVDVLNRKYNITSKIQELSGLSRQQVADVFRTSDIMLMTSISEGSPQAVKEALACDLPIVSTPVGDVQTLLEGVSGCYVSETSDAEELASLVVKSLSCNNRGVEGRKRIMQLQLDLKATAEKIYRIYCDYYQNNQNGKS